MVQKNFGIYSEVATEARLYVEIGNRYIACWCVTDSGNVLLSFELFEFSMGDAEDIKELLRLVKLHSRLFDQSFGSVTIIWSNRPSIAVPAAYYTDDSSSSLLLMETGEHYPDAIKKEDAGNVVVAYSLPTHYGETVDAYFNAAKQVHKKSLIFNQYNDGNSRDEKPLVKIAFYTATFSIVISVAGSVKLYQQFEYQTSEDVLYHTLNCLLQTGTDKKEALVYVGGMIEQNSALYKELHMYLANMQPDNIPADLIDAEAFAEYPAHYFSPFYSLVV